MSSTSRPRFPPQWEAPVGAVVVEDDAVRAFYTEGWSHFRGRPEIYTNASYHLTYECNARSDFDFVGSKFWLIGDHNSDHGRYTITFDRGTPRMQTIHRTSYWSTHVPFRVLFEHEFEIDTTEGETKGGNWHTVQIQNAECGKALGIDAFAYMPILEPEATTAKFTPTAVHDANPVMVTDPPVRGPIKAIPAPPKGWKNHPHLTHPKIQMYQQEIEKLRCQLALSYTINAILLLILAPLFLAGLFVAVRRIKGKGKCCRRKRAQQGEIALPQEGKPEEEQALLPPAYQA